MEKDSFTLERTFNAGVSVIWDALTDKTKMKEWYFDLPEFKAEVGFEFRFEGGPPGKSYLHICTVTEVVPHHKLTHSWRYEGYAGNSFVTWELFPEGKKTRVRLTHTGLGTFPADNPDFARKNFEAGWNEITGTSLKKFVEQ